MVRSPAGQPGTLLLLGHFVVALALRKADHQSSYGFHHTFRIIEQCLGYGMGGRVFLQYDASLL